MRNLRWLFAIAPLVFVAEQPVAAELKPKAIVAVALLSSTAGNTARAEDVVVAETVTHQHGAGSLGITADKIASHDDLVDLIERQVKIEGQVRSVDVQGKDAKVAYRAEPGKHIAARASRRLTAFTSARRRSSAVTAGQRSAGCLRSAASSAGCARLETLDAETHRAL